MISAQQQCELTPPLESTHRELSFECSHLQVLLDSSGFRSFLGLVKLAFRPMLCSYRDQHCSPTLPHPLRIVCLHTSALELCTVKCAKYPCLFLFAFSRFQLRLGYCNWFVRVFLANLNHIRIILILNRIHPDEDNNNNNEMTSIRRCYQRSSQSYLVSQSPKDLKQLLIKCKLLLSIHGQLLYVWYSMEKLVGDLLFGD